MWGFKMIYPLCGFAASPKGRDPLAAGRLLLGVFARARASWVELEVLG